MLHTDHCVEVLRLAAMCRMDLSVYTFSWPNETEFGAEAGFLDAHSTSVRQCMDWSELEEYMRPRSIGLAPTLLWLNPDQSRGDR